jgi:4-hydroxythreonine-4-phosphate dehydrogenase
MKVIAITLGDPAGIGPEVFLRALMGEGSIGEEIAADARIIIFGSADVLNETCRKVNIECEPDVIQLPIAREDLAELNLVDLGGADDFVVGEASKASGRHALVAIYAAVETACKGNVDALVTMPVSKVAFTLAGAKRVGHTEILRDRADVEETTMFLENGPLRFAMVTKHLPIREVPDSLSEEGIAQTIRMADRALREYYKIARPTIGVMAVNPHGGENGLFGGEEREKIIPAVKRVQSEGVNVRGPFPADVAVAMQSRGSFDGLVAMYHDQALVPLKLINGEGGFNMTLGLPFVRTSPLHGTAYDIAGKNLANPASTIAAIRAAIRFASSKTGEPAEGGGGE